MKKIFSIVLSLSFLFVNIISVHADNSEFLKKSDVKNEYLEMKKLQSEPESKLRTLGFEDESIKEIKQLDVDKEYSNHIYSLQKYSNKELKQFNYSDKQINLIKNFDGDVSQLTLLGSSCRTYISKSSFVKSGNRTKAVLNFSFKWNGVPYFKYRDALVFAWNNGLYVDKNKSYLNVTYKGRYNSQMVQRASQKIIGTQDSGVNYTFPVNIGKMNVSHGSGVVYLDKIGDIREIGTRVEYGHREVVGTPSASLTISGSSIGINFDKKTKEISYNTARFRR